MAVCRLHSHIEREAMSIAIIGSGIVGASAAYHLTTAGEEVCVFSNWSMMPAATTWSFACLNTYGHLDSETVETRLAAIGYQKELVSLLGLREVVHANGTVRIALNSESEERMCALQGVARDVGVEMKDLSRHQLLELEPSLDTVKNLKKAIFIPCEGWSDAIPLRNALLGKASTTGLLTWKEAQVNSIHADDAGVRIQTTFEDFGFSHVIVCAGANTNELLSNANLLHPVIYHHPGLLAILSSAFQRPNHVIYFDKFHLRPDRLGTMIGMHEASTVDLNSVGEQLRRECLDALVARARFVYPMVSASDVVISQLSVRPIPLDGRPVCGFVDKKRRIGLAVMHGGITLAPYLTRLLVGELLTSSEADILAAFSPHRSSLENPT
ncbi:FAD-dependent oxidoreductase [Sinorhizobium medicae]|nr:FAD-dependent oxidoreductase [Sinorhizobium medicae]